MPYTPECDCTACMALYRELGGDTALYALYRRKLLIEGWAGQYTAVELAYRHAHSDAKGRTPPHLRPAEVEKA